MKNKLRKKDLMKGLKKGLCLGLAGVMLATGGPVAFGENTKVEARDINRSDINALMSDISTGYSNARVEFSKFSYQDILKLNSSNEALTCRNLLIEAYDLFLPKLEEHYKSIEEKTTLSSSYINSKIQTWSTKYSFIKNKLSIDLKERISSATSKYKDKDKTKYNDLIALNNSRKNLLTNLEAANTEYVSGLQNAKTRAEIIERVGNTVTQSPVQTQAPTQVPVQTQAPASNTVKVNLKNKYNNGPFIQSATLSKTENGSTVIQNLSNILDTSVTADKGTAMTLTNIVLSNGQTSNLMMYTVGQTDSTWELDLSSYATQAPVQTPAPVVTEQPTAEPVQTETPVVTEQPTTTPASEKHTVLITYTSSRGTGISSATVKHTVNGRELEYMVNSSGNAGTLISFDADAGSMVYLRNIKLTSGAVIPELMCMVIKTGTEGELMPWNISLDAYDTATQAPVQTVAPTVAPTQAPVQIVAPTQAPVVITEPPVPNGPVFTEKPVPNGPVFTEKPVYTQAPVYTQKPVNTYNPGNTTPVYTQAPVVADNGNSVPGTIYTPNPVNPTFAPVNPGTVVPATSANPGTGATTPGTGSTEGNVGPNYTQKPDANPGTGTGNTVPGTVKTPTPQQTEDPDANKFDENNKMEIDDDPNVPEAAVAELTCTKKDFKVGIGERFKLPVKGVGVTFKGDAHCSVDKYGYVKAKKAGNGKVVVTDGANIITVNVTVKKAPSKVKMKAKAFKVKVGKQVKIIPTFNNNCWSSKNKWKSSNKKIFTVKNGKIKGIKKGTAKLTVITYNGKKATAKIIVYR